MIGKPNNAGIAALTSGIGAATSEPNKLIPVSDTLIARAALEVLTPERQSVDE